MTTSFGSLREIHKKRKECRICRSTNLIKFLELGETPLANSFLKSKDEFQSELSFPLDVYFCQQCSLVQLLDVIHPEVLFRNYIYVTGTSETIARHNQEYSRTVVNTLKMDSHDLVIEIASNDGSLLTCFKELGVKTLGIEPAINIAEIARSRGIETVTEFFNHQTARNIKATYGTAKAVIANNVLAHVDETRDFMSGCKELISPEGMVIIEVPYLRDFLERLEYDTVYHEHLCYFSVTTLMRLCESVGLSLVKIEHKPVHGGSLRMYAGHQEYYPKHGEAVLKMVAEERQAGLTNIDRYHKFARDVQHTKTLLLQLLDELKSQGKSIAGYGAPAKGNTLLNYCGISTQYLDFTVDKNPMKVGLFTPGTHIPVLPVSELLERQPDYVLILAWNFAEEIMRQQQEYQARGGKFIIPIPTPTVV